MSTQSPMCKTCHHRHRLGDPHIWSTEKEKPKDKRVHNPKPNPVKKPNRVHNTDNKRVHTKEKQKDVYTVRQVSIRQLRANMAKELNNTPFDIIRNGIVIARVLKP